MVKSSPVQPPEWPLLNLEGILDIRWVKIIWCVVGEMDIPLLYHLIRLKRSVFLWMFCSTIHWFLLYGLQDHFQFYSPREKLWKWFQWHYFHHFQFPQIHPEIIWIPLKFALHCSSPFFLKFVLSLFFSWFLILHQWTPRGVNPSWPL